MDLSEKESIRCELVLQRFESVDFGDDLLQVDGGCRIVDPFDVSTWQNEARAEYEALKRIFEVLSGHPFEDCVDSPARIALSKLDAIKFLTRVAKMGFFGSHTSTRTEVNTAEIKDMFKDALVSKQGTYTFHSLSAVCYSYRDKSGLKLPGDDPYEHELEKVLKVSVDQEFRFRTAFSVIAGTQKCRETDEIPIDRVGMVFHALGFSVTDDQLKIITKDMELEPCGTKVKVDSLYAMYEQWHDDQLKVNTLKAIYNMLVREGTINSKIAVEHRSKIVGLTPLPHSSIRNSLNKILKLNGTLALTNDEIRGMLGYISSSTDLRITLMDFIKMFQTDNKI
jgi:hypothetical protein